jgi:signal peptidase I
MKHSLIEGDFVIVYKSSYKLSTPATIPFTGIKLSQSNLISFSKPSRGDVVVFQMPLDLLQSDDLNNNHMVKRIVGVPGDTLKIVDKEVFINNRKLNLPKEATVDILNIKRSGLADERIFPADRKWNSDNYGPLRIPAMKDTIHLNPKNIKDWELLINIEQGLGSVSVEGTVINVRNRPVRDYVIKKDYYFVMGDNRDDSFDSRFFGFVPEDAIVGKVKFVYWSVRNDSSLSFPGNIRFDRIFKSVE